LTSEGNVFVPLTIDEEQSGQAGSVSKAKLSLIQPLQPSLLQDQIVVISSGISSNGFLREYMERTPSVELGEKSD